jgi:hypothetical protein
MLWKVHLAREIAMDAIESGAKNRHLARMADIAMDATESGAKQTLG